MVLKTGLDRPVMVPVWFGQLDRKAIKLESDHLNRQSDRRTGRFHSVPAAHFPSPFPVRLIPPLSSCWKRYLHCRLAGSGTSTIAWSVVSHPPALGTPLPPFPCRTMKSPPTPPPKRCKSRRSSGSTSPALGTLPTPLPFCTIKRPPIPLRRALETSQPHPQNIANPRHQPPACKVPSLPIPGGALESSPTRRQKALPRRWKPPKEPCLPFLFLKF